PLRGNLGGAAFCQKQTCWKIGGINLLAATGGWWVIPPAYLLLNARLFHGNSGN
ncbi:hypothetical protein BHECKSOX_2088, partial [Bathymodiolus heckerae thiotrophic gill symbiont]